MFTILNNEDFEPHSIYVNGHLPLDQITPELAAKMEVETNDHMRGLGFDEDDCIEVKITVDMIKHRYMKNAYEHDDGASFCDEYYPFMFCHKDDKGAFPITGVEF